MRRRVTLTLVATMLLLLPACGNNKRFDSAAWLKADARERGRMSEDLVKRKILVGSSRSELLSRLDEIIRLGLIMHIMAKG